MKTSVEVSAARSIEPHHRHSRYLLLPRLERRHVVFLLKQSIERYYRVCYYYNCPMPRLPVPVPKAPTAASFTIQHGTGIRFPV